ncbi:MAG TPA: DUF3558 family protein [Mycobacteriales bacterium]|nr:DUF3558 family protein [Mycobacteriales bacterium]
MPGGRRLCCLAALVSTVLVGGCAATVSGHASIAAGVPTPGPDRAVGPSGVPSGSPGPSGKPTPGHGGGPTTGHASGSGAGQICTLFSASELNKLFGGPVRTADNGNDRSCAFQTASSGGVMVNVYDFLNMKQEAARDPGGKPLTIAGHPAYQGKREILVARTSTPSASGLIVASNLFVDDEARGNQIAARLLEKIVPKFAK